MGFTLNSWMLVRTPLLLGAACLAIAGCGGQGDDEPAGNGGGSGYDAQIGDMIVPDGYAPTACQKDNDCAKGWECMDIPDQGMFCVPDDPAILLPNCLPVPEACNGLDDDCDGKIDDDSPCDDGNACNGTETCTAGICQAGKGTGCEDDNVCTTDACDPEIGCTHNVSTAVTCEDGDACTGCIVPAGVRSVYLATAAAGCPEAKWSGCNALWMPGFYDGDQSHIVRFELSAGARFDWYADGTGHLSGTAFAYNLGGGPGTIGEKWDLSVWFKFRGVGPAGEGSGGPKLDGGWYVPKTLTDSWFYFDMMPGLATMKQAGGKEVVEFTQKPVGGVYPFQVGQGANNKTMAFSSSGWLDFVKHTAKGDIKSHGDINVDLALTSIPADCDLCQNGKCQPGLAKTCDDGNDCTADSCDAKKGACVNKVQSGTACEDGIACTTGEKCNQGKCKPGKPDDSLCEDGNPCTKDHCTVGVGCVFEGADPKQPCDDSDACTAGDQCQGKKCKAGTALDCDDANPCTEDLCDPTKGCTHGKLDGAACEDGDACTSGDACSNGTCAAGAAKSCDDDNVCTTDSCDPKKGCLQAALDGTGCDDGNACSDGDACVQGKCKSGGPKVCDDGQACTIDSCDWQAGCGHKSKDGEACDDGTACTVGDACAGGLCVPGKAPDCNDDNPCTNDVCAPKVGCVHGGLTGPACDDGSACTLGDACAAGKCTSNAAPDCQDGNECTADSCDAAVGCVHANLDGKGCTDGNACSGDDLCAAGKCAGGAAISCDDLNGCTTDSCDGVKGCVHTANTGAACDDGNACTAGDACKGTVCAGAALACDDGNVCTDDTCKAATGCAYAANGAPCNDNDACTTSDGCSNGKCAGKAPLSCDDGNPCTIDSCNSGGGCVHKNADGWKCDDGNACSTGDACLGGQCKAGAATACDDDNACTSDGCAAKSGCWHTAQNGGACNDDNACTSGDACQGGVCAGKGGVDCNDGNACTTDSCDKQSGCTHVGIGGKACSDGSACTAFDTCQAGKCVGQTVPCTDNNACTADSCNVATGCVFGPADGGACNDGSACTQKDACLGGKCVGVASGCDDGNPCTTDGCDDAKGCSHVLANGLACDDGNACSTGETCTDGKCGGGVGANCDDGDPCTGDSCGAKGSCIHEPLSNGVGNLVIVSDGATQANGKPAVQTWDQHTSWTASIPGATWIWTSFLIGDPIGDTSVAFTRNFNVPAGAKGFSGKLVIAADNSYACTLNGIAVGQDASEFNYFESGKDTWDLALALKAGSNTLQCTVKNWAQWYGSPYSNPAGLLYKLTAAWTVQIGCDDGNGCTVGDQCFGGKCASGPAKSCDDSNGCTADACNPATGACSSTANSGGACHDGNACTGACLPPGVIATFQPGSATNSGGHGFWLPGFFGGGTVRFSIDAAQSHFDLYADKAHLHGIATIFDGGGAKVVGDKWSFDIWLKYRGQGPGGQGAGGPKLGVIQSIPKSLTNTWKYFDMVPGQAKLTKVGNPNDYALLTQAPVNSMYPFQFGAGANYFGLNMGACSWLTWKHHVGAAVTGGNGDINLDMTTVNPAGTCDQCTAGKCGGASFSCDDSNPCTADSCNASVGCVHTKIAGCTGG